MGIYDELGVKRVINCMGPYTKVGGSLMPREVMEAMHQASESFVSIDELLQKAGKRIAELTGAPAAFITSGAAAGLAISAAACMAGSDPQKAKQLPDTSGMKNEILVQRCHRIHYDQAIRVAGAHLVEVGFSDWSSVEDLKTHITDKSAAILYVAKFEFYAGSIPLNEVIRVAKDENIPVIVDAADELPPLSNLYKYTEMGADLVTYSGGKGLLGPQGSGLLLGNRNLIEACAVNGSPNYGIGRAMKVDKEEIVGLLKAIELFVNKDFEAQMKAWKRQQGYIIEKLSGLPNIDCVDSKPVPPGAPGSFYLPAVYIDLEERELPFTKDDLVTRLWEGDPRIAVDETLTGIAIRMMMLEEGQERTVAEELLKILKK